MRTAFASGLAIMMMTTMAYAQKAPSPDAFVNTAAVSNMFEIETSKAALERATSPDVKTFAQQMIDDHTKASNDLKEAASKAGVGAIPEDLDAKHKSMLQALDKKKGAEFDRSYVQEQRQAHDQAVKLFSTYASNGTQADLKSFAATTLPTLQMHQQHVRELPIKK
jgi:putative membrane protein